MWAVLLVACLAPTASARVLTLSGPQPSTSLQQPSTASRNPVSANKRRQADGDMGAEAQPAARQRSLVVHPESASTKSKHEKKSAKPQGRMPHSKPFRLSSNHGARLTAAPTPNPARQPPSQAPRSQTSTQGPSVYATPYCHHTTPLSKPPQPLSTLCTPS